jgi:hypothetical protein
MKVKQVSAFRAKRGLRRASGAEPQVVGLASVTTDERKTYILRAAKTVEDFCPGTDGSPADDKDKRRGAEDAKGRGGKVEC